jgi:hypothetical protein
MIGGADRLRRVGLSPCGPEGRWRGGPAWQLLRPLIRARRVDNCQLTEQTGTPSVQTWLVAAAKPVWVGRNSKDATGFAVAISDLSSLQADSTTVDTNNFVYDYTKQEVPHETRSNLCQLASGSAPHGAGAAFGCH